MGCVFPFSSRRFLPRGQAGDSVFPSDALGGTTVACVFPSSSNVRGVGFKFQVSNLRFQISSLPGR